MNWLKSPLFWKTVGIYLLLSVLALGGLLLTLSETLDERTAQFLEDDASHLLSQIRHTSDSWRLQAPDSLWDLRRSESQVLLLCDDDGTIPGTGDPQTERTIGFIEPSAREQLISDAKSHGTVVTWLIPDRVIAGAVSLDDTTRQFVLMGEDVTERFALLSAGRYYAVRAAIVAWLCGTACMIFVATTVVSSLQTLIQAVQSREESLERRHLLSTLGERGDEYGTVARLLEESDAKQQKHLHDVTEQAQEIRSTATQLSAILQAMADGVIAVDQNERVLFANQVAGRLLDINVDGIEGRPLFELVRTRHLHEAVQDALNNQGEVSVEFRVPQRDLFISLVVSPGADAGAVLLLHDNTEVRRLESMRRDFVSGVSHELKTPLTVIQACTETLLESDVDDPDTRRNFLQQIDEQSERLLQLILGMLQLARVESGAQVLAREPVDLREVVNITLRGLRPVAEGRNITLTVEGLDELFVLGDFAALQTVTGSIVDNAIKYTAAGGRVKIELTSDDEALVLRVADNGIGIPLKEQGRVFERFYRVDRDRNRERGGTGLGLAIVKHLCQAMQADIALESDTGQGCIVEVRFPADPEESLAD